MEFTFAQTDINELMEGICRQMQEKNSSPDIQILFTEKADQCMMYTDRIRLSQVIINFTNNALKFTPKGVQFDEAFKHFIYLVSRNSDTCIRR